MPKIRSTTQIRTICQLWPLTTTLAFALASPCAAQTMVPPKLLTTSPTGVNLLDGTFTYDHLDLSIGSLALERYYIGGPKVFTDYFGPNWSHNYDIRVTVANAGRSNVTTVVIIGRTRYTFAGLATSNAVPESGSEGTSITVAGGYFIFTDRDGVIYRFPQNAPGVSSIEYTDGSRLDFLRANGQLKAVLSNRGYAIVFDYDGSNRVVNACGYNRSSVPVNAATTCASASIKVSYSYNADPSPRLASFTDVLGHVTGYRYGESADLSCVTLVDASTCRIANFYASGSRRIEKQRLADGGEWTFTTDGDFTSRQPGTDPTPENYASYVDPLGGQHAITFRYNSPVEFSDPLGRKTQTYYIGNQLAYAILPEGNSVEIVRNDRFMPLRNIWRSKVSSEDSILTDRRTYPSTCSNRATCNKASSSQDAKGNQTDFGYTDFGALAWEMSPAPTGGSYRPLTLYTYDQRYARLTAADGTSASGGSIWMLSSETICQTVPNGTTPACDPAAERKTTSFEYGAAGSAQSLLVIGKVSTADGTSRRTCYLYDVQGNRISETAPRAGRTTCE